MFVSNSMALLISSGVDAVGRERVLIERQSSGEVLS
jgi:hypothetical protein